MKIHLEILQKPRSVFTIAVCVFVLINSAAWARVETQGGALVFGALANGNIASVREQVNENPALAKAHDDLGQTLLHLAAQTGSFPEAQRKAVLELAQFLIEKGADVNTRDNSGQTPLQKASQGGNPAMLELLRAAGGRDPFTPLFDAIRVGDGAAVGKILDADPTLIKTANLVLLAVQANDATMVKLLLARGGDAVSPDAKTRLTPLLSAIQAGHAEIVQVLLASGEGVLTSANKNGSALRVAQNARQWKIAALLVSAGAKPEPPSGDSDPNSLLEDAAAAGQTELVKALLDAGANPAEASPLQKAIVNGQSEVASLLLARGAPVNADGDDYAGRGPLHIAALTGDLEMLALLLQKNAAINAETFSKNPNKPGSTPLSLAVGSGRIETVRWLLKNGANANDAQSKGEIYSRTLQIALSNLSDDIANLLLQNGARFGHELFDAILQKNTPRVQALLDGNAALANFDSIDIAGNKITNIAGVQGFSPLGVAALMGDEKIVRALIASGAKVDATNISGATALHFAAAAGSESVLKLLLESGADAKLADKKGATPLHYAAAYAPPALAVAASTPLLAAGAEVDAQMGNNFETRRDLGAGSGARIEVGSTPGLRAGATALNIAARQNKTALAEWLLDHDANVNGMEKSLTPLHEAAHGGAAKTVVLLLARGANVNAEYDGRTPLHDAIAPPSDFAIHPFDFLGARGENFNSLEAKAQRFWESFLQPVVLSPQQREIVAMLLKHGADPLALPPQYFALDRLTPLDLAARARDRKLTGELIAAIKDVNAPLDFSAGTNSYQITPLMRAARFGDVIATELLLARGAKPNLENSESRTALDETVSDTFQKSLSFGEDLTLPPPADKEFLTRCHAIAALLVAKGGHGGSGPLFDAILASNLQRVRALVTATPALLRESTGRRVPLIASIGKPEIMAFLLESGADPNARDNQGTTALYQATQRGDVAAVRLLLEKGADVNAGDMAGATPLALAQNMRERGAPVAALLQERGARSEPGLTMLMHTGNLAGVRAMLEADPAWAKRVITPNNLTALHIAAGLGKIEIVRLLLEKGADLKAVSNDRYTPLYSAARSGQTEIVTLLLDKGADVNFDPDLQSPLRYGTNSKGQRVIVATGPPLYGAIVGGHQDIVALLLARGGDIHQKDVAGNTALQHAEQSKEDDIAEFLAEFLKTKGATPAVPDAKAP